MFLANLIASIQRWRRNREATRMLYGFSDRALRDIGLDRGSIGDVVWHGR